MSGVRNVERSDRIESGIGVGVDTAVVRHVETAVTVDGTLVVAPAAPFALTTADGRIGGLARAGQRRVHAALGAATTPTTASRKRGAAHKTENQTVRSHLSKPDGLVARTSV